MDDQSAAPEGAWIADMVGGSHAAWLGIAALAALVIGGAAIAAWALG